MSILNKLTIKNLKLNKKRTIVTIIGIILSTALMVGIGLLFSSFQDYMIRETIGFNGRYEAMYSDVDLSNVVSLNEKDFECIPNSQQLLNQGTRKSFGAHILICA